MNFKTPDPKMAGFITIVLLLLFGFAYIAPVLNLSWLKGTDFNEGFSQTLQNVLLLAIGYYIGGSKSSDDKNAVIATQATTAATIAAAASPLTSATPAGTPDDPVAVTEVK